MTNKQKLPFDFIQTFSGQEFSFTEPRIEAINIYDISHALSQICRFGGHTSSFYSVADHSCNVAECLVEMKVNPTTAFCGILHDAAECYIGDVVTPLKKLLGELEVIEERICKLIYQCFEIDETAVDFAAIKEADTRVLLAEVRDFFNQPPLHDWTKSFGVEPFKKAIYLTMPPHHASERFLNMFSNLKAGGNQ